MVPFGDKVLVTLVEKKGDGLIVLAGKEKGSDLLVGRVIKVGKGLRATDGVVYPPDVKEGSQVVFFRNRAIEVDSFEQGEDVSKAYLIAESELLAEV